MSLKDDAKKLLEEILGPGTANIVNSFDDPKKYPKDFLDECVYFLGTLIGPDNARKKFEYLYKKYIK